MSDEAVSPGQSPYGRRKGSKNHNKEELRALVQESVLRFTEAKRERDLAKGLDPDLVQPIYENYDPVVEMAIAAVDHSLERGVRILCHKEVAQYLRPKLKSVEITEDPEALALQEQKMDLAKQLVNMLDLKAAWKKRMAAAEAAKDEDA